MFLTVLLLSLALMGFSFLALGIKIFFTKNGKFAETHVGKNKALQKKKVYCIKTQQKIIDKQIKIGVLNGGTCPSCDS